MAIELFPVKIIGHIRTDFTSKFGVPRQSGIVDALEARVEFEKEYRQPEAFRGLEGFSQLWIIWQVSEAVRSNWSATVRPPRLGGNKRVGVFATRSPFRPNAIGLSAVKIKRIELDTPEGPVIYVSGADLMDGTPILDVKPYLAYADSHPDAVDGFAGQVVYRKVSVVFPQELLEKIPENKREPLLGVLQENPAPHYQKDPERVYGFGFAGKEIKFKIQDSVLTVVRVE